MFRNEIIRLKNEAKAKGLPYIEIVSGDVHRNVGGYTSSNHRMPICCDVMDSMKNEGDEIIYAPVKGKGATLKIRYYLNNDRAKGKRRNSMEEILEKILTFRRDRDWEKFHTPKDLAISLSLEASELLENFQWKDSEEALRTKREDIKDELADVFIYSLLLAHDLNLDIKEIIENKIQKNEKKYPVEKAFGSNKKYTEL